MPGPWHLPSVRPMETQWEMVQSGPADAQRTVLLLPGGMCSAESWAELMAEPALAGARLVAVTLPGQAGTPAPDDPSVEWFARATAELAKEVGADVVVGFSMGAVVAYEMVVTGAFMGPVVLTSLTLSSPDEPAFFRGIVRLTWVLGRLPMAVLKKGAGSMVKHAPLPAERRAELGAQFARNDTRHMGQALRRYVRWLAVDDDRAQRLADAGVPAWVVHAEKGDGGLTPHERAVLEACPHVRVVTIPGKVFFLPNEVPARIADVVVEALAEV